MNDQQKLPYMNAFLQEIFRSSNILPMNLMHATTQDVNVGGYHLEKGTSIVLQMASIHMDEKEFPGHSCNTIF
jgi:cytochrome P450